MLANVTITAPSSTTLRLAQPASYLIPLILGMVLLIPLLYLIYTFIRHPSWKPFLGIVPLGLFVLVLLPPDDTDNVAIVDSEHRIIRVEEVRKGSIRREQDINFAEVNQVTIQYNRGDTRLALILKDGSVVLPLGVGYVQNEPMHFKAQTMIEQMLKAGRANS